MEKPLGLLGNQLKFFGLTFLTALIVVGLGVVLLNTTSELPQSSVQPAFTELKTVEISSLLEAKGSLPSVPAKSARKESGPYQDYSPYSQSSNPSFKVEPQAETYLGHFSYTEDKWENLIKVADFYGREEFLDKTVADAFSYMQADAQLSRVELTIISGFRSLKQQQELFIRQIDKLGSEEAAAQFSAPPGYSEHHTGYALDIGEGHNTDTYTKFAFEYTEAYHWLSKNAQNYGFELSFPKNNFQGVSYEPWHWRFVGSPEGAAIFAQARLAQHKSTQ